MKRNKKFLVFVIVLSIYSLSFGQTKSKSQLQKEKVENIQKIKEAEKILLQTERRKQNTIGQLTALNQQIMVRQDLIKAIATEIKYLDVEIEETESIISSLQDDLHKLKTEYASMVFNAYKVSQGVNTLSFLFSAESFNQFYRRLKYIEFYGEERRNQAREIEFVAKSMEMQLEQINKIKSEKKELLKSQVEESNSLNQIKKKQRLLMTSLSRKEAEINLEIDKWKLANNALEKRIAEIVKAEIRKNSIARNRISLTPEAARLSASFAQNQSKLPWPVESGFISKGFGPQSHPVFRKIKIDNKGVDIQTNNEENVRSVFNGIVTAVINVPGMNNAVLVRHGEYLTVYANLEIVKVSTGQELTTKDLIGTVHTNTEGISELHFEVWKNNVTLNPQKWLYVK